MNDLIDKTSEDEDDVIDFRFKLIRTPMVDEILESNAKWVADHEGSDTSPEIKEEMKMRDEVLHQELVEIQEIQNELLEHLENNPHLLKSLL